MANLHFSKHSGGKTTVAWVLVAIACGVPSCTTPNVPRAATGLDVCTDAVGDDVCPASKSEYTENWGKLTQTVEFNCENPQNPSLQSYLDDKIKPLIAAKSSERIAVDVSGECKERLKLKGYQRLVLVTNNARFVGQEICDSGEENVAIDIDNSTEIVINGFEIRGYYTHRRGKDAIGIRVGANSSKIAIIRNDIHDLGVRWSNVKDTEAGYSKYNGQGIKVAAKKSEAAIQYVHIRGNHLHDLHLGYTEALAVAGNVERFDIISNHVHDIDNIGIDLIGGEDYENAQAKTGNVCGNRIGALRCGNPSYRYEGKEGTEAEEKKHRCTNGIGSWPAAAGIYVDGGRETDVHHNCVSGFDYGIQVSAEKKNPTVERITISKNKLVANRRNGVHLGFGGDKDKPSDVGTIVTDNMICIDSSVPSSSDDNRCFAFECGSRRARVVGNHIDAQCGFVPKQSNECAADYAPITEANVVVSTEECAPLIAGTQKESSVALAASAPITITMNTSIPKATCPSLPEQATLDSFNTTEAAFALKQPPPGTADVDFVESIRKELATLGPLQKSGLDKPGALDCRRVQMSERPGAIVRLTQVFKDCKRVETRKWDLAVKHRTKDLDEALRQSSVPIKREGTTCWDKNVEFSRELDLSYARGTSCFEPKYSAMWELERIAAESKFPAQKLGECVGDFPETTCAAEVTRWRWKNSADSVIWSKVTVEKWSRGDGAVRWDISFEESAVQYNETFADANIFGQLLEAKGFLAHDETSTKTEWMSSCPSVTNTK